ncbi:CSTF3 [Cordylochernes scorpioides]|uniref:CSTF3 n=1 Tax=Cordylochernes scorpioides TaxID=51811 RepID=A0ABY6KL63_9ARAC|nr:CSTF3 [Cordylochernes scorpioides]
MWLSNSREAIGSYAENQRITAVRKVYQRGIVTPMINIEQLWKDYVANEQGINATLADKIIQDRSRDYMNARRVAKEYEAVTRGLNRNAPSVPPQGTPEEIKQWLPRRILKKAFTLFYVNVKSSEVTMNGVQVDLWKKYIQWEKDNPLRTEDQSLITKRVMFAYEQCLLCLGHHPDIWYEAALFLENSSKLLTEKGDLNAGKHLGDEAAQIYERAISSHLKTNTLLYFAYADFEESRMKYDKVHQIYTKFINLPKIDPTLAYIQYMKFARRAEGIKSARAVFKKAREDQRSQQHIFVAAALMEYYCSKDKNIAFKIFELGLKKHPDNPDYIKAYINYLSHLNEDNNTRVLFERVLTSGSLPAEKSVDIWNQFLEFESNIGDLNSIVKVEKRRTAVIGKIKEFEGKDTALLIDRYKFMDLYPCTPCELRSLGYMELTKQHITTTSVKTEDAMMSGNTKPTYCMPDVEQMFPYKPRQVSAPAGVHPIPGGVFPVPPTASHLLSLLPPPTSFLGPFVAIDALMELLHNCSLPDHPAILIKLSMPAGGLSVKQALLGDDNKALLLATAFTKKCPMRDSILGRSSQKQRFRPPFHRPLLHCSFVWCPAPKPLENGGTDLEKYLEHATESRKRKAEESEEEDGGNAAAAVAPPVRDIYRARQQKRVK